ncbi:hypothetical protein KR093_008572 [Drosophila rubida]|uniref:Tsg C-terminal domain-containing protein n=1 Tax=Drosophila rubida TaxID=30044 RepID=A0AAD4JWQ1_9MUSC|nr:hypothetical protein KR093_008572 [Drosophila rubida]
MSSFVIVMAILSYYQSVFGDMSELSKKSHVEDFEGVTVLFEALTSSSKDDNWQVFTFPTNPEGDNIPRNCTVVYLNDCKSWNKCRQTCYKTGATSYRWFHDGCCECVGGNCPSYGINESRCIQCPEPGWDDYEY